MDNVSKVSVCVSKDSRDGYVIKPVQTPVIRLPVDMVSANTPVPASLANVMRDTQVILEVLYTIYEMLQARLEKTQFCVN